MTTGDDKTKRLKKYEAEPLVSLTDGDDPRLDFFSPFGPMIARGSLPPELVERVNGHADRLVAADQSREFVLPESLIYDGGEDSLAHHVARTIKRYLAGLEGSPADLIQFEVFWIVSQYAATPSPVHFHSEDIAGVAYLKVPEIDPGEESKNYISGRQAGYVNFLTGGKQRFSKSLISFKPEVGDLYLFPGWLLHGAEPFRGSGERRSMSFNARVGGS